MKREVDGGTHDIEASRVEGRSWLKRVWRVRTSTDFVGVLRLAPLAQNDSLLITRFRWTAICNAEVLGE